MSYTTGPAPVPVPAPVPALVPVGGFTRAVDSLVRSLVRSLLLRCARARVASACVAAWPARSRVTRVPVPWLASASRRLGVRTAVLEPGLLPSGTSRHRQCFGAFAASTLLLNTQQVW